jgi:hypothetical protein
MRYIPAATIAGRGWMSPEACRRWIPVWLPGTFVSPANVYAICCLSEDAGAMMVVAPPTPHPTCTPTWRPPPAAIVDGKEAPHFRAPGRHDDLAGQRPCAGSRPGTVAGGVVNCSRRPRPTWSRLAVSIRSVAAGASATACPASRLICSGLGRSRVSPASTARSAQSSLGSAAAEPPLPAGAPAIRYQE